MNYLTSSPLVYQDWNIEKSKKNTDLDNEYYISKKVFTKNDVCVYKNIICKSIYNLMTDFKKLCEENLGHQDYINIAKKFKLIFLNNVPELNEQNKDSCRRFISLIDMLYENNCSIVILASKPISNLNTISNLAEEFARTTSRLYAMTIVHPSK